MSPKLVRHFLASLLSCRLTNSMLRVILIVMLLAMATGIVKAQGMCPREFNFSMGSWYYYNGTPIPSGADDCASTSYYAMVHDCMVPVGCDDCGNCKNALQVCPLKSDDSLIIDENHNRRTTNDDRNVRVTVTGVVRNPIDDEAIIVPSGRDVIYDRIVKRGDKLYRLVSVSKQGGEFPLTVMHQLPRTTTKQPSNGVELVEASVPESPYSTITATEGDRRYQVDFILDLE